MYRKILVPLDGSTSAEKVLPHVVSLAHSTGAEVVLMRVPVHAYPYEGYAIYALSHGYRFALLPDDCEEALSKSKKYLNKRRNEVIRLGLRVAVVTPEGEIATRIIEYAHRPDVDMIAMAAHRPSRIHRMFFGSIVDEVMREADKPVLLIRPECAASPTYPRTA